eukprot:4466713-Amphidinium_carterae.2
MIGPALSAIGSLVVVSGQTTKRNNANLKHMHNPWNTLYSLVIGSVIFRSAGRGTSLVPMGVCFEAHSG